MTNGLPRRLDRSKCKTYASTQRACWSREWGVSLMYVIDLCP